MRAHAQRSTLVSCNDRCHTDNYNEGRNRPIAPGHKDCITVPDEGKYYERMGAVGGSACSRPRRPLLIDRCLYVRISRSKHAHARRTLGSSQATQQRPLMFGTRVYHSLCDGGLSRRAFN